MQPYRALIGLGIGIALAGAVACGKSEPPAEAPYVDEFTIKEAQREARREARMSILCAGFMQDYFDDFAAKVRRANPKIKALKQGDTVTIPEYNDTFSGVYFPRERITVSTGAEIDERVLGRVHSDAMDGCQAEFSYRPASREVLDDVARFSERLHVFPAEKQ